LKRLLEMSRVLFRNRQREREGKGKWCVIYQPIEEEVRVRCVGIVNVIYLPLTYYNPPFDMLDENLHPLLHTLAYIKLLLPPISVPPCPFGKSPSRPSTNSL
jgi:hypothetical protein